MKNSEAINQNDAALLPFLKSVGDGDAEIALSELLLQHIQPVIEKTLRAKMHVSLRPDDFSPHNQEALEIAGEAKLLMVAELNKLNSHGKTIQNLKSYVTSVTINAYREYLRKKYPRRLQLKNKLRYLLTHHPNFALVETEDGWICGNTPEINVKLSTLETIQAEIAPKIRHLRESAQTIELVKTIFETAKSPVFFSDLLAIVAETQGIKDTAEDFSLPEKRVSVEEKTLNELERRESLKQVWTEIGALPVRHRVALLLNLRDKQDDCLIFSFPLLRIASVRQIAETLEFPPDKFAAIWRELPWNDGKIAGYLGLTRQQVINLRQSARARLNRRFRVTP